MLKTEQRNPYSTHIDKMTSYEMMEVISRENFNAAKAVDEALPQIAEAVEKISERINKGGRLFYIGCGTSGRLGILDASECPPTYGVSPDMVIGLISGGDKAIRNAVENAEDNFEAGQRDIGVYNLTELDSIVGISVAGGAQYVIGALELAKEKGALTVGLTCNEGCKISQLVDVSIITDTGAEVITGSSRMKAGTAHKMVLNMISTGIMIKYGRVYENFMIYVKPMNVKLRDRMIRIVSEIANVGYEEAERRLEANNWEIKDAVEKG